MNLVAEFEAGLSHHQAGRLGEAESIYRNILAMDTKHAGALLHLGLIAHQMGQNKTALDLIGKATKAQPKYVDAHYNQGIIFNSEGDLENAATCFRQAARLDKKHVGALYSLAGVQYLLGEPERALKNYKSAAKLAPDMPEIHTNLAVVLRSQQKLDDALASVDTALNLNPHFADAIFNRGDILADLEHTKKAVACYDRLLTEDPNNSAVLINKAAALQESANPEAALTIYDQIIKTLPDQAEPISNKANVLVKLARYDDALAAYDRALKINPRHAQSIYHRALCFLVLGRMNEGFPGLEHRFENEDNLERWQADRIPFWQKDEELAGPLFIRAEQGVGDHLIWSTQIPLLLERGIDIVFEADPRLTSMLSRSFPKAKIIAEGSALKAPQTAKQIGMASVPYFLADWEKSFKPDNRIFESDPTVAQNIADDLSDRAKGRPIIGISWRSARRKVGPRKSLPLDHWQPILANRDALFVNLQYGETDTEIAEIAAKFGAEIYTLPKLDRMNDLDDFAGLIDTLDLVITTSNVTAHFAGGLGKPCWLALQKTPIWYWGHEGKDSRFYPSIEIYRQDNITDWSNVITDISSDLAIFLKSD
jgi:tetratricopeptide (TPR) repeat protein